ncbi:threonine/serine exporter family protein [Ruficoccus sp. ZRK36]|uniref:threonine/serine exporter family protein n=1 Tax=Ruficoccus sp. ZRK36 TaxID=2866311 RepID=UPI001C732606|nr:threonine/serine exporter family protein [Ruficoccus sp. ZRK36]QYY36585.1 threonine/serine exporter family protein [Ruficoccus sp. ZRK36]
MTTDILLASLRDMSLAFLVAIGWGVLFGTPKRVLWVAAVLGGSGHCLRFALLECGLNIIPATLAASLLIGVLGIYFAHRVDNPPVVFTMPACITMIPGMYAYRSMLGGIKITSERMIEEDPTLIPDIAHNITLTFSLLAALAIGISVGVLLFRKRSVRDINLPVPPLPWNSRT